MRASIPVVLLIVAAAGFTFRAFWLAHRESQAVRGMVTWLRSTRAERWAALPWMSRQLFVVAGIEALCREGVCKDREFTARYDEIRRLRRLKVVALLLGMAPIAMVLVGTAHWGWAW